MIKSQNNINVYLLPDIILFFMEEIWRTVKVITYEGEVFVFDNYVVSNTGKIKSLYDNCGKIRKQWKELKPDLTGRYSRVVLFRDGKRSRFSVHRIVATTFPEICGDWFDGAVINHKDCNTRNNAACNLEWCTSDYNNNYLNHMRGVNLNRADLSKPIIQLTLDGEFVKWYPSIREAERTGITSKQNIMRVLRKKNGFQAAGFIWEYEPVHLV